MLSSREKKRQKSNDGSPVALPVGSHAAVSPVGDDDDKTKQEEVDEILYHVLWKSFDANPSPVTVQAELESDYDQLVLVNRARRRRGLVPLKSSENLQRLAVLHAIAMAQQGAVFHSVSNIEQLMELLSSRFVAENIQRGDSIVQMHQETMEDRKSINRSNQLCEYFTEFGSAVALGDDGKLYSCQLFRRDC